MSNNMNLADSINFAWRSGKTPTFIYNGTTYEFSPAGLLAFFDAEAVLPDLGITASADEVNILDGATLSTAELNVLDEMTSSTAELNILTGATLAVEELNILDGVTVTAAEINRLETTPRAVVPTVDGLTTGLLVTTDNMVSITAANAAHWMTMPAIATMEIGQTIRGKNSAQACELRTVAASGTTINGVDADGTNEAPIAANAFIVLTKTSATNFMYESYTDAGVRTLPAPTTP